MDNTNQKKRLVEFQLAEPPFRAGDVAIVGAGPGDPGLLTLRALMLIQQADVVLHDRLVSPQVMELVNPLAECLHVGKCSGNHSVRQEDTNALLVQRARQHQRVIRLKGGDPYILGRGGEEAEYLMAHGVHFQVVPGITSASGCAAHCGIPLTHRDYAQSVVFVTGHRKADQSLDLEWSALASPNQTRVFYMGLSNASAIAHNLMHHGVPGSCPVALIERGTTEHQRTTVTSLAELPGTAERDGFQPPTLIIVGDVVTLASSLRPSPKRCSHSSPLRAHHGVQS